MRRILVLAYMLSPYRGSEYSVAWNYVSYMSRNNYIKVLYGTSGDCMGDCIEMEKFSRENHIRNVDFVAVYPNKFAKSLNWFNKHGYLTYTFYFAYQIWHKQVYKVVKEIIQKEHFDLIHYVGMIGYREPGYLWKLGLPYVWGPVSGVNNAPKQLLKRMPLIGRMKFTFRSVANVIQFYTKLRLKRALSATDILLTATSENQRRFREVHHKDSICIPENCITGGIMLDESKFVNPLKYHIIVVGKLCYGKAINIFLEALTQVVHRDLLHIDIVGDGPQANVLREYAVKHNINDLITWHGQLPRIDAVKIFNSAHLHVITSVSEGNPTTIWEAMSYGVPTMSFDHCGMHDTLCDKCGIRIPITGKYEDCVAIIAYHIDELLRHPERFYQLAKGTLECARHYTWTEREKLLNNLYNALLSRYK